MKKIIIAGGGASGMAAAISAAASGASVVLLEAREQTGKKLLRTGGGRCNFTNEFMDPSCYYGDPDFIRSFLERFSTKDCLDFFKGLGLLYRERDGYYYPYSNSAASVLSVLNAGMKAASCSVYLNSPVTKTRVLPEGSFEVFSGGQTFRGDALILSAGSAAGNDARGFSVSSFLPEKVKLPMRPFQPALTMLYGSDGVERAWEGVRCRGSVTLGARKETGELQLLSAGISGIPVFQISRNAVRMLSRNEKVLVSLDFLPDFTEDTVQRFKDDA